MTGILLEEIHVSFNAPAGLSLVEREAMRQIVNGRKFMAELRRSVRDLLRCFSQLSRVRVVTTR